MPHININIEDNTGVEVTGNENVVFIPGSIEINTNYKDTNSCTYIPASYVNRLDNILVLSEGKSSKLTNNEKRGTLLLIEACLLNGLDVIYCYMSDYGDVGEGSKKQFPLPTSSGDKPDYFFLYDKDNYNVKILTTGYYNSIKCAEVVQGPISDGLPSIKNDTLTGIDTLLGIARVAQNRKDCVFITGVNANNNTDGDLVAAAVKKNLSNPETISDSDTKDPLLSYVYILVPDLKTSATPVTNYPGKDSDDYKNLPMPSIYAYIQAYGKSLTKGTEWLPTANSERGYVGNYGTPALTTTKYVFDNYIITDPAVSSTVIAGDAGSVSLNGIVNLKPYGNVIWGDRTLLRLSTTVKATAYLSLRLLVCDVAKRAYQSAVRYTYESNNDVTWFNFKIRVTELLDEMVAAGVLSNYKMIKQPSTEYNKITCKITLYPNLPVENFDIYINLENAEISTSGEEE